MLQQHKLTTLDSGVRIVTEAMPSVRSVSVGFWIGTGSRTEDDEHAGLSHLLEHLLFKGTEKYGSLEIDQIFDGMGAELNAGTGKETTSVYARVIDDHVPEAFDASHRCPSGSRFPDGTLAHDEAAQRRVPDEEAGVDRDAAVEAAEPVAEGAPVPGQPGLQRGERHALDPGHHPADVVGAAPAPSGASEKPQLPPSTVVTPCSGDGLALGSQKSCAS